jgi:hypothetical protein
MARICNSKIKTSGELSILEKVGHSFSEKATIAELPKSTDQSIFKRIKHTNSLLPQNQ